MMMVVWTLWALQLSGIIAMGYGRLWLITTICIVAGTILNMIKTKAQQKLVTAELEQCGDVKDEHAVAMLLTLILHKIAVK